MSKTIMIVDDSASIRTVVGIALRGEGYQVIEAKDGQDAINKLIQRIEIQCFNVHGEAHACDQAS